MKTHVIEREVTCTNKHECSNYNFHIQVVVVSDTGVFCRKSSSRDRAKGMAYRIKKWHAATKEHQYHRGSNDEVNEPE